MLHYLQTIRHVAPSTGRFGDSSATPVSGIRVMRPISAWITSRKSRPARPGGKGAAVLLDTVWLFSKFLGSKRLPKILRRLDVVDEKDLLAQIGRNASGVADLWQRASDRETLSGINSRVQNRNGSAPHPAEATHRQDHDSSPTTYGLDPASSWIRFVSQRW